MKLHIVPARTGLLWVREGLRTFWQQPLALAGLFFMFIMIMSVASLVPWVGNALALACLPAATLGLMAATREAAQGRFPMPTVLLSAFRAGRQRARAMAVLGAIYALSFLAVLGISALIDGGSFARVYLAGGTLTAEMLQDPSFHSAAWVAMALYMPMSMLFWHAPALVHWHGVSPVKSLFFSGVACVRNFAALTVYTLVWIGLIAAVFIGLMMLTLLLGRPAMLGALIYPTALMMAAMFSSSIWFTFRDSFIADDAEKEAAPGA